MNRLFSLIQSTFVAVGLTLLIAGSACLESPDLPPPMPAPPDVTPPADPPTRMVETFAESQYIASVESNPLDPNGDGVITKGEITMPSVDVVRKNSCSEGVEIVMKICLYEIENGMEKPSVDLNKNPMCAEWQHLVDCDVPAFNLAQSDCVSATNAYCDITVSDGAPILPCGWKVTSFQVRNADDGQELEFFTPEAVEEIVYTVLPTGDDGT